MGRAVGCLAVALLAVVVLFGAAFDAFLGWLAAQPPPPPVVAGPVPGGGDGVYRASERSRGLSLGAAYAAARIDDLGYGNSDGARIDRALAALRPRSPLVGQGARIVSLGVAWRIDPLLLIQWIKETQLLTDDGITTPIFNGGNIDWKAAVCCATQTYGCRAGPSSLGHTWAACPTLDAGLNLWFDYVATRYLARDLAAYPRYVDVYNPCWDPYANGNCGDRYGREVLGIIAHYAGPPTAAGAAVPPASGAAAAVIAAARGQIGVPYSWGGGDRSGPTRGICCIGRWDGRDVVGFDCSGLMEYSYWQGARRAIGGNSREQYARTRRHVVATGDPDPTKLAPGDLLFWGGSPGTIHHVALYIGGGRMIQAPRHPLSVTESAVYDRDFFAATRPLAGPTGTEVRP